MQKLICFDLDGTLSPHSSWELLNAKLGITPEQDQELFDQYKAGTLTYEEWTPALVRIYKENNPVKRDELRALAESVVLREEARQCIVDAKSKGYDVLLMSGSVDVIVEGLAKRLGIPEWLACSKGEFNENEELIDILSMGDEGPAKLKLLQEYCDQKQIAMNDVITVGDGGNEREIFQVTKGILLGDNKELIPFAWKQVENLSEVNQFL